MRTYPVWLALCSVGLLVVAAPANAAKRPPRPIVASHDVKVKAGYVGQCPRRARDCAIPDVFVATAPVPVHSGGFLRINTRRSVRRLRLYLDCPHRRFEVVDQTRWTFALPDGDCSTGELNVTYRRVVTTYTFNLKRHEHPCLRDESTTVFENELVRVYSHPVPAEEGADPSYPGHAFV
ncbi:MAG: hypothetical protein ACRDJY_10445, partial [Thermoleophilaceae bacterium]